MGDVGKLTIKVILVLTVNVRLEVVAGYNTLNRMLMGSSTVAPLAINCE